MTHRLLLDVSSNEQVPSDQGLLGEFRRPAEHNEGWQSELSSSRQPFSIQDGNVVGPLIVDEPADLPTRPGNELLHLGWRHEQVIEPGVHQVAVVDAKADLSGHAVARTVSSLVGEVYRIFAHVRVVAGRHEPVGERTKRSQ